MYAQLTINPDGGEQLSYNQPDFPVRCVDGDLSRFHDFAAGCHWHNDFEILLASEGDIDYFVNGEIVSIRQGQAVFINANRLHYGFSARKEECLYSVLVFHPDIFGPVSLATARYAHQIASDEQPDYLLLTDEETLGLIRKIRQIYLEGSPWQELQVLSCCSQLTHRLHQQMDTHQPSTSADTDWLSIRQMIGYLQTNYARTIRLEDIAAAGTVCRSKCCQLFREKLHTTPMAYLNRYRLEKGRELLLQSEYSITEVAHQCGFESSSYFSEMFRRMYGQSPRAVRNSTTRDP